MPISKSGGGFDPTKKILNMFNILVPAGTFVPSGVGTGYQLLSVTGKGVLSEFQLFLDSADANKISLGVGLIIDGVDVPLYAVTARQAYRPAFTGSRFFESGGTASPIVQTSNMMFSFNQSLKIMVKNLWSANVAFNNVVLNGGYYS